MRDLGRENSGYWIILQRVGHPAIKVNIPQGKKQMQDIAHALRAAVAQGHDLSFLRNPRIAGGTNLVGFTKREPAYEDDVVNLQGACFIQAQMDNVKWYYVDFSHADLSHSSFVGCKFNETLLRRTKVNGTTFTGCQFFGTNAVSIKGSSCRFISCEILGTCFEYSDFEGTTFQRCLIDRSWFYKANLMGVRWEYIQIHKSNLRSAVLARSEFRGDCSIVDNNFRASDFREILFDTQTELGSGNDLTHALTGKFDPEDEISIELAIPLGDSSTQNSFQRCPTGTIHRLPLYKGKT